MTTAATPNLGVRGLTIAEVEVRQRTDGYNELPRPDQRTTSRIVLEVLREPMLALLLGGGVVYLLLGDVKEALILLAFATMSVVITVVQESRTEKVLESLRDLTSPRAVVIRDGVRSRIAGRDVVRGDIVVLAEGDRVPADAILFEASNLRVDESLLTGESVPVGKSPATGHEIAEDRHPGGDDRPFVYSGSLVVGGSGLAQVTSIGVQSEIGRIGHALGKIDMEPPRLRAQTQQLVWYAAIGGALVSSLVVVLYGLTRGGWMEALLAGIAIGMSMLPEEFPVVLAVFMAMGAWRISQARVLTRRAAAIETLGSATVLCTDKTGTLTENLMSVAEFRLPDGSVVARRDIEAGRIHAGARQLAEVGKLASAVEPFDPMEKAIHDAARLCAEDRATANNAGRTLVKTYALSSTLLAVTNVWQTNGTADKKDVATKGAPEAIADLCHLDSKARASMHAAIDAMATAGLRVLGIAQATHRGDTLPSRQSEFDFEFLGLIGLADPLRATVPRAVAECQWAGIRVVMITGDYPATANAIARAAGIDVRNAVTGDEIRRMSDADLAARVRTDSVFARIMPDQKLRIVNAFKANGEIVAMTGDGVNDAPSLKAANIGIAMGGRGTDVAREASSIVLLDDDFGSIVKTVRLGRRIYDNLRKAMGFIIAVHVPVAGLALMPLVFGLPILFGPIHIAFLEMIVDPVCSLAFEAEEEEGDVMRRPPRSPEEPLFSLSLVGWSITQGCIAFAVVAAIVLIAFWRGTAEAEVRSIAFFSLVAVIVGLILVNRSFSSSPLIAAKQYNPVLLRVLAIVAGILFVSLLWQPLRDLMRFGPLRFADFAIALAAGIAVLMVLEASKRIWFGRH